MKKLFVIILGILIVGGLVFLFIRMHSGPPSYPRQGDRSFSEFSGMTPTLTVGNFGVDMIFNSVDSPIARIQAKSRLVETRAPQWIENGGDSSKLQSMMQEVGKHGNTGDFVGAEKAIDNVLALIDGGEGGGGADLEKELQNAHLKEQETFISDTKKFNLTGIEEYVAWSVTEKKGETSDWGFYKDDALKIKSAGVQFAPFLWMQSLPSWAIHNPKYVLTKNALTGLETEALSMYAPETLRAYDHFYGEAKRAFGDTVDRIRIGSPFDFGETSYPGGAASAFFPLKNLEPGFWVGEAPARDHFKNAMMKKYSSISELNTAWNTNFSSFEALEYPTDTKNRRSWLDFIHWYHDGFTERMGAFAEVAQKYFPTTPISFNLGWPYEKINLGQSLSGLVKMAGEKHLYVRTPTGAMVPFLYTKHVATAVHQYHPAGYSSEPIDSNASCEQIDLAQFKDLTIGIGWHFDYSANYDRCQESFAEYRTLWPKINGEYPVIDTALFFPTTAHFLENSKNWSPQGFSGGFPDGLQSYAEDLRDVVDYDVLDERLIADGYLKSYRVLIWPVGKVVEAETMEKIKSWIEEGGILLIADLDKKETVEGGHGAFQSLIEAKEEDGVRKISKGSVIEITAKVESLPQSIMTLDAQDDVLMSSFKDGALLFNNTKETTIKKLPLTTHETEVTLKPYELRFIPN